MGERPRSRGGGAAGPSRLPRREYGVRGDVGRVRGAGASRLPRREYGGLLREAVAAYDFPAVVRDFHEEREFRCRSMCGAEEYIRALLHSSDPDRVRNGLSNVLYWGWAQQPGLQSARVRVFRDTVGGGDPRLHQFMQFVRCLEARPQPAGGRELLQVKQLGLPQFGRVSFASKILMFLDPSRFPVLDLRLARAYGNGWFAPLADLRLYGTSIPITQHNARVYEGWARWCREIAAIATAETPGRRLMAVDVERALFARADQESAP